MAPGGGMTPGGNGGRAAKELVRVVKIKSMKDYARNMPGGGPPKPPGGGAKAGGPTRC